MSEVISQKHVPNLILNGELLDCLTNFSAFYKGGKTNIVVKTPVIPSALKEKMLRGELHCSSLKVQEFVRTLEGEDKEEIWIFPFQDYTIEYQLDSSGGYSSYCLSFKN